MRPALVIGLAFFLGVGVVAVTPARAAEKRTFSVAVKTPATNYLVKIEHIYQAGEQIWVVARVRQIGDIGGAAITTVKDKRTIEAPAGDVKTFILGKTWNWADPKSYTYPSDEQMKKLLEKQKEAGTLKELYAQKK